MTPRRETAPYRKALGEAIRGRRAKLDLSQEEVAFEAEVDRTYWSGLEAGARNPTLETLLRVANALGVRLSRLLGEAESHLK